MDDHVFKMDGVVYAGRRIGGSKIAGLELGSER